MDISHFHDICLGLHIIFTTRMQPFGARMYSKRSRYRYGTVLNNFC